MDKENYCIELKATLLHLPSYIKTKKKYPLKYYIGITILLFSIFLLSEIFFTDDKYRGLKICIFLLSSLPLATFILTKIDIDTLNVYETYPLVGNIKFNSIDLFINGEKISFDAIQQLKLDFNQHGNISWSTIDEKVKNNMIQNPHNVSIGGRNGYHFQKTYNSIIVYLKNGAVNRYSFFLDDITTKQTVQEFINFCYKNNLPFKEFTNGIRSYRMKNNLSYSEIQHIKKEHDLTSWV